MRMMTTALLPEPWPAVLRILIPLVLILIFLDCLSTVDSIGLA